MGRVWARQLNLSLTCLGRGYVRFVCYSVGALKNEFKFSGLGIYCFGPKGDLYMRAWFNLNMI